MHTIDGMIFVIRVSSFGSTTNFNILKLFEMNYAFVTGTNNFKTFLQTLK